MTSKSKPTQPTAITVSKPPARRKSLGEPPQTAADTASVGNNTNVPADDKLVDLGFKVPQAWRRNFRTFCASNDLSQVDALREAMADYMAKKGWEPSN
jgi:hypothetical protein